MLQEPLSPTVLEQVVASEREFPYGAREIEKARQVLTQYILHVDRIYNENIAPDERSTGHGAAQRPASDAVLPSRSGSRTAGKSSWLGRVARWRIERL